MVVAEVEPENCGVCKYSDKIKKKKDVLLCVILGKEVKSTATCEIEQHCWYCQ